MPLFSAKTRTSLPAWSLRALLWSLPGTGLILLAFRESANATLATVLLWHLAAGVIATTAGFLIYRRSQMRVTSDNFPLAARFLVLLCASTGYLMIGAAATGYSARSVPTVYDLHILTGGALIVAALWRYGLRRLPRPSAAAAAILFSALSLGAASYNPESWFRILTGSTTEGSQNALFPARIRFEDSEKWTHSQTSSDCSTVGCHSNVHSEWRGSAHSTSALSPAYARSLRMVTEKHGQDSGRWCAGCHDPASLRPFSAERGIDCLSCHAIRATPSRAGGGFSVNEAPEQYPLARATDRRLRGLHDFLLRVRPSPHISSLSGPVSDPSNSCLPCHRNGIAAHQNGAGYLLHDDTWGQWKNSHYSGSSLHTFRPTGTATPCTGCHPAHSSAKREFAATQAALKRSLSVRLIPSLAVSDSGESSLGATYVKPGERVLIDVMVQNHGIGHGFPSGSPDLKEAWLEIRVSGANGEQLAVSEGLKSHRTHRYGMTAIDIDGNRVAAGTKWDSAARLFDGPKGSAQSYTTHFRAVAAGEADVGRYAFNAPIRTGAMDISAVLWYRDLADGGPAVKAGSNSVRLIVSAERPPAKGGAAGRISEDSETLYAYGIALFRRRDLTGARTAFELSRIIRANEPESTIAIGRTFLDEGDLLSARTYFQNALRISPGSGRARAWLGRTLRLMGQYERALTELIPLTMTHPEDPETWTDIGVCQIRLGRFSDSIDSFRSVLALVPDDSGAHFNLMLAYRRTMRITEARREEAIYLNLKNDGRPGPIVQRYLRAHPDEALEHSVSHEHAITLRP